MDPICAPATGDRAVNGDSVHRLSCLCFVLCGSFNDCPLFSKAFLQLSGPQHREFNMERRPMFMGRQPS